MPSGYRKGVDSRGVIWRGVSTI